MPIKSLLLTLSLLLSFNSFANHSNETNKEDPKSASAWLYKGKVLPPSTFKKEWMSSDNFEEFEEHFKIETKDCLTNIKPSYTHCRSDDFRNNTGLYFGREINNLDPIMVASWGEPVSLAVAIDDVDFDQTYTFVEYKHTWVNHKKEVGDEMYRIMNEVSVEECKLLAPHIDGQCKESYLVDVADWGGGSMKHQYQAGIYGLFKLGNGKEYIVPLKYMEVRYQKIAE